MEIYQFEPELKKNLETAINPFAIFQYADKRIVPLVLSAGFCEMFGFKDREDAYYVMSHYMYRDTHPDDVSRVAEEGLRFANEGGDYDVVYRTKLRHTQDYIVVHSRGRHFYTRNGSRLSLVWYMNEGMFNAEQKPGEEDLNRAFNTVLREGSLIQRNYFDSLTGLPNMAHFFELAEAGVAAMNRVGQSAALVYFNICGTKLYNRQFGYAGGDDMLRKFAALLTRFFGSENCGRFGQDHFAAISPAEGLEETLKRFFEKCGSASDGNMPPVKAGVYCSRGEGLPLSAVCDRAKDACDSIGSVFRSAYRYFDDAMLEQAERRRYIIFNLDRALAERWVKVYLQPIIRTANGRIADVEVLARWVDPVKGMLVPSEFISILEDARLIYKLDLYMVEQALWRIRKLWDAGHRPIPFSVNLSRSDFDVCDMVEEIRRRVDETGLPRSVLIIEITESTVGKDPAFMKEQVERFHDLGFQVWMDDFGSEYSSLDFLQNIHFDVIKFDMRFMQQFDRGEKGRIILTELSRMAASLGINTVAEGVETREQMDFLRDVGCTGLQGYFFCQPARMTDIVRLQRAGKVVDFENPDEAEYYSAIGRISLYDMAVFSHEEQISLQNYFNTLPMAIIETGSEDYTLVRCNSSYRDFKMRLTGVCLVGAAIPYDELKGKPGYGLVYALRQCGEGDERAIIDELLPDGSTAHLFIKRVAVNPVTGVKAVALALLAVTEPKKEFSGVTYSQLARALSTDYFDLFYVDLDTEEYTLYSSNSADRNLSTERHGDHFFASARRDAEHNLCPEDVAYFRSVFTRERVLRDLDEHSAFTITYRQIIDGKPTYVSMKAVRMSPGSSQIIIGVNNVDAQTREKQALERVREERSAYERLAAIAGDYVFIYSVDPATGEFNQLSVSNRYPGLRLSSEGEDFFRRAREIGPGLIWPEDLDKFLSLFTRERVLEDLAHTGVYELQIRMRVDEKPLYVRIKAVMVEEADGPQIILGVSDIDARVRTQQSFEQDLADARAKTNTDPLTGVKNKLAFDDALERLDQRRSSGPAPEFAVVLFDVKSLKSLNARRGISFGDDLLRQICADICTEFKRSPVYRIDGDEFAVIAQGHDYRKAEELLSTLRERFAEHCRKEEIVIDCALARSGQADVARAVFVRAERELGKSKT